MSSDKKTVTELLVEAVARFKSLPKSEQDRHFENQKKAWVTAEIEMGDEGTRVVK